MYEPSGLSPEIQSEINNLVTYCADAFMQEYMRGNITTIESKQKVFLEIVARKLYQDDKQYNATWQGIQGAKKLTELSPVLLAEHAIYNYLIRPMVDDYGNPSSVMFNATQITTIWELLSDITEDNIQAAGRGQTFTFIRLEPERLIPLVKEITISILKQLKDVFDNMEENIATNKLFLSYVTDIRSKLVPLREKLLRIKTSIYNTLNVDIGFLTDIDYLTKTLRPAIVTLQGNSFGFTGTKQLCGDILSEIDRLLEILAVLKELKTLRLEKNSNGRNLPRFSPLFKPGSIITGEVIVGGKTKKTKKTRKTKKTKKTRKTKKRNTKIIRRKRG